MKKIIFIFLLILIFDIQYLFALKLYLKKGIIISKASIITDMKLFPRAKTDVEVEVEAVFGNSPGRTTFKIDEIINIKPEDEEIVQPVIVEKKGNVSITNPFISSFVQKGTLITPYTIISTAENSYAQIGLDDNPVFMMYPETKINFDICVEGLHKLNVAKNNPQPEVNEPAMANLITEKYLMNLMEGTIVGCDVNNLYNKEYDIYLPDKSVLKITAPIYYVHYKNNKIIIGVLSGAIVYDEQNNMTPTTISNGQIAEIDYTKEAYIVINNLNTNRTVAELLNSLKSN